MVRSGAFSFAISDPLDVVWLATARRLGLRVGRSSDCYAATDGTGALALGSADTLDADDCLAQMVLHEICHWLVQGPGAIAEPDWGLDNASSRDLAREFAALSRSSDAFDPTRAAAGARADDRASHVLRCVASRTHCLPKRICPSCLPGLRKSKTNRCCDGRGAAFSALRSHRLRPTCERHSRQPSESLQPPVRCLRKTRAFGSLRMGRCPTTKLCPSCSRATSRLDPTEQDLEVVPFRET